jgi:outer membrane usher protein
MRSYERNKISIDATTLPPDAIPEATEQVVAPMRHSGVGVDFGVKRHVKSVMLILTDPAGKPIETGSRGKLVGGGSFLVGYDGRAFVREVSEENEVVVDLGDHDCHAVFTYAEAAAKKNKVKAVCQ